MNNIIDIHSRNDYPSNQLSNFYPHIFIIDGINCGSMEGFLQSLKFKNIEEQIRVCSLSKYSANKAGQKQDWKTSQKLYWLGNTYERSSEEYQILLTRAFDSLSKNPNFCKALLNTGESKLIHSIGKNNIEETILTEDEFCRQLTRLRNNLQKQNIFKRTLSRLLLIFKS